MILTRTTNPHKSNKKTQDLLVNTSSGNRALYIAGYQRRNSKKYDRNQWFMYALIRKLHNTVFSLHSKSVHCVQRRWQKIIMGVNSVAYGGHLYSVCIVCYIYVPNPTFWRSLLTYYAYSFYKHSP